MAIISQQIAPNRAPGKYFRVQDVQYLCSPDNKMPQLNILVAQYVNEQARKDGCPPLHTHQVLVPFKSLLDAGMKDPRDWIYQLLMQTPLFAGTNAVKDTEV